MSALGRIGALSLLALTQVGCWSDARFEATHVVRADHVRGSAVEVRTRNGSISVVADSGAADVEVIGHVRAQTAERAEGVALTVGRGADDMLVIGVDWPGGHAKDSEGVSFEITAPDAYGVRATTSNGRVRVVDVGGNAILRTSNGRIEAVRQGGGVDAVTSNGRIETHDVGGPVDATTSNGAVRISFASGVGGEVDVSTSNGSVSVDAPNSGFGTVSLRTSNGKAVIEGASGSGVKRAAGSYVEAELTPGAPPLTVHTSNGSIRVRLRDG